MPARSDGTVTEEDRIARGAGRRAHISSGIARATSFIFPASGACHSTRFRVEGPTSSCGTRTRLLAHDSGVGGGALCAAGVLRFCFLLPHLQLCPPLPPARGSTVSDCTCPGRPGPASTRGTRRAGTVSGIVAAVRYRARASPRDTEPVPRPAVAMSKPKSAGGGTGAGEVHASRLPPRLPEFS
jgi:hypothetical protein